MKIEQFPFDIDFPLSLFSNRSVDFSDEQTRKKLFKRNIYSVLPSNKKNILLDERGELFYDLAKKLKEHLNKNYPKLHILSVSLFGSSLYTTKNKDYDFLVIVKGNEFDMFETELMLNESRYDLGVSIKGEENLFKGEICKKSTTPYNLQRQIIYRTSISLAKRHIPIIGMDFRENKKLFLRNCYSQVSDLLSNTSELYYSKNKKRLISQTRRSRKILSRLFEAITYLSLVNSSKKIKFLGEKILKKRNQGVTLNEAKEIFREVVNTFNNEIRRLSSSRKKDEVLSILLDKKAEENITERLKQYWKIIGLPSIWINEIIRILKKYHYDEDKAIKLIRHTFPQITKEDDKSFSRKLKLWRIRKIKNLSERVSSYLKEGSLLDVGGRGDDLAKEFIKINNKIKRVIITDVGSYIKSPKNTHIEYIVQPSIKKIPLKPSSVKNVFISMVLHHIPGKYQKEMIESVVRSLSKGGRLILIEDSFPQKDLEKFKRDANSQEFLKFNLSKKKKIIYFYDWFGNRLMRNRDTIPIIYNYKSMERWNSLLNMCGMKTIHSEFVSENLQKPDLFPPKAFMVFEKIY